MCFRCQTLQNDMLQRYKLDAVRTLIQYHLNVHIQKEIQTALTDDWEGWFMSQSLVIPDTHTVAHPQLLDAIHTFLLLSRSPFMRSINWSWMCAWHEQRLDWSRDQCIPVTRQDIYIYMKSSDAKASKCHLKFYSLMMIFYQTCKFSNFT